ncbi:MAG TPA: hypothetical protein VM712_00390, partial [Gaiellales bacterium]|nr:hypothetical protein [Gaiellales bacterium]
QVPRPPDVVGHMAHAVSRRHVLKRALAGTSAAVVGESLIARSALADPTLPPLPAQVAGTGTVVDSALPSAKALQRDVQRMVDFGPRLTGSASQDKYLDWLEKEFAKAGCQILPRKTHPVELWEAQDYGLQLLEGSNAGPVHVSSYFPRSGETPAGGVEGELVYCGALPPLQLSANDPTNPVAALQRFVGELPDALQALLNGLPAGSLQGNVALIDLPFPPPLTEAWLSFELTYSYWPGHTAADQMARDYRRGWILGGQFGSQLQQLGAVGAVFILDASKAALDGDYVPFSDGPQGVPMLHVDRDTGAFLRKQAQSRPKVRSRSARPRPRPRRPISRRSSRGRRATTRSSSSTRTPTGRTSPRRTAASCRWRSRATCSRSRPRSARGVRRSSPPGRGTWRRTCRRRRAGSTNTPT